MVLPSWQTAQCLSHKLRCSFLLQLDAQNNEQTEITKIPIAHAVFLFDIIKTPSY